MTARPLNGLRVVEGSAFVAAPLAGMTLAQLGADVIRFDRIQGGLDWKRWPVTEDGASLFWAGLNKGKRSFAVDMRSPEGQELVAALITAPGPEGGVFLTNLRVRGWMDYPALKARREDLIMVSLIGDRHGNPQVDYTVNPALGFPMATGPEGSDPVAHVLPAWDLIAGHQAAMTILAAERARRITGEGSLAELSLKDTAAAMMGALGIIGEVAVNGVDRAKAGNSLYGAYGQDFACRDGGRLMVIGLTDRQWRNLVKVTGAEAEIDALAERAGADFRHEGERWEHRAAITEVLAPWFAAHDADDAGRALSEGGCTWSKFRSFGQAVREDPDLSTANPMFHELEQPDIGTYPVAGSAVVWGDEHRLPPVRAPRLGEHTAEILEEVLGLSGAALGGFFDRESLPGRAAENVAGPRG